jgi:phage terminase small subunit
VRRAHFFSRKYESKGEDMASKGPRPQSARLRLLHDNAGRRPITTNELNPRSELPPAPDFLDEEASLEWKRLGDQLLAHRLISVLDLSMLTLHVCAWSTYVNAHRNLKTIDQRDLANAAETAHLRKIAADAGNVLIKTSTVFGLGPSLRHRVSPSGLPREESAARKTSGGWEQFD